MLFELLQQGVFDLEGHSSDLPTQELLQAREPELGAVGAVRFGDSIGIQAQQVPGTEREARRAVGLARKESERQAVRRQLLEGSVALQEDSWIVTCIRVLDVPGRGVQQDQKERDETVGSGAPRDRFRKTARHLGHRN